jgi:hypothetical protein
MQKYAKKWIRCHGRSFSHAAANKSSMEIAVLPAQAKPLYNSREQVI